MWIYQKKLEYPVNITTPNPRMAKALMAQYGGPDFWSEKSIFFRNMLFVGSHRTGGGLPLPYPTLLHAG